MNQDFTVKKKSNICLKKIRAEGFTCKKKKNSCTGSEREKKFVQAENSRPPPPPQWSNGPSLMMKLSSTCTQYFIFTFLMFYAALMY